jgi:hypothetical protein
MHQLIAMDDVDWSTPSCQLLGMHISLHLSQPIEVMKFLRKNHRPVRKKQCRDHAWRPSDLSPITLYVQDYCM